MKTRGEIVADKDKPQSDAEEFQNTVGTQPSGLTREERNRLRGSDVTTVPSVGGSDQHPLGPGDLVQYRAFAEGYMPTTGTIPKLPTGCYSIRTSDAGLWFQPIKIKTDKLLVFPDTKSDLIVTEVRKFWGKKKEFTKYGFTHKRGFLIWGPAGSGKSSCLMLVTADVIKRGGIIIVAEHPKTLSLMLAGFRSVEPDRPLLVIWEDIDAVITGFGESEVLAVLDGETQVDNVVFIATTNYPEKLDARIINRPSRFDMIIKIGLPSPVARAMYLENKIGTTLAPDGTDMVKATNGLTFAHLRELIVGIFCLDHKVKDVVERLQHMKVKPNSSSFDEPIGFNRDETKKEAL